MTKYGSTGFLEIKKDFILINHFQSKLNKDDFFTKNILKLFNEAKALRMK